MDHPVPIDERQLLPAGAGIDLKEEGLVVGTDGTLGKIDLFLPAYPLGVLNVEAFIRLKALHQVFTTKSGRAASMNIHPHLLSQNLNEHRNDMFEAFVLMRRRHNF